MSANASWAISLSELKSNEKELVAAALKETRGKIYGANGAAALLGLKPTTLASKLVRLGLKREAFLHGGQTVSINETAPKVPVLDQASLDKM
jgi:DNA-binding NtrC family response regulator